MIGRMRRRGLLGVLQEAKFSSSGGPPPPPPPLLKVLGISPPAKLPDGSYSSLLHWCIAARALPEGRRVHSHMALFGRHCVPSLAAQLLRMYALCGGSPQEILSAFRSFPCPDRLSWNLAVSGLARSARPCLALFLFREMPPPLPDKRSFLAAVSACARLGDLREGERVHLRIISSGLGNDLALTNSLIHMYGKCCSPTHAQAVFDSLHVSRATAFSQIVSKPTRKGNKKIGHAVISDYAQYGHNQEAILVARRKETPLLNARIGHGEKALPGAVRRDDAPLIDKAQIGHGCKVMLGAISCEEIPSEDAQYGHSQKATLGVDSSEETPVGTAQYGHGENAILGATSSEENPLADIQSGHSHRAMLSAISRVEIPTASTHFGRSCKAAFGAISSEEIPVASSQFVHSNKTKLSSISREAAPTFNDQFRHCHKAPPDSMSLSDEVPTAVALNDVYDKDEVQVANGHFGHCQRKLNPISMMAKVKGTMPQRDVVSWNAMIAAYAHSGLAREAMNCLALMVEEGFTPNKATFLGLLKSFTGSTWLNQGRAIHRSLVASGLHSDMAVVTALVSMYGKCGSVKEAQEAFDSAPSRNVILWTALIAAHIRNGNGEKALELIGKMDVEGIRPNNITFLSIIDACASSRSLGIGKAIHDRIHVSMPSVDVAIGNALIHMYGKCGSLEEAKAIFNEMAHRNVISWNAMIAAFARNGHAKTAIDLLGRMRDDGLHPDSVTFLNALHGSGKLDLHEVRRVHECIGRCGGESDVFVMVSLLTAYGKCGSLEDARTVFDRIESQNVAKWNAMIVAYSMNNCSMEALELFHRMDQYGVTPDRITFLNVLNACSTSASLENGRAVHDRICEYGLELDIAVKNALLNMYGKCGSLTDACKVFYICHLRNAISWAAMIIAYAQNGHGGKALELARHMGSEGVHNDNIILLAVLNACSHAGLLDEAWQCFVSMCDDDACFTPMVEHYVCIIDLLGRAGRLNELEDFRRNMHVWSDSLTFTSLLGACQMLCDREQETYAP